MWWSCWWLSSSIKICSWLVLLEKWLKTSYCLLDRWKYTVFNEDSGDFIFHCSEMDIVTIDLNNINHEDTNYNKDDIKTVI